MNGFARVWALGGLAALVVVGALPLLPSVLLPAVVGEQQPQRITSDTTEYCLHLLDQVSELVRASPSPPPAAVTSLSAEGQLMCERGQTRGGILRLRRAMVMMTRRTEQQYPVSVGGIASTAASGPLSAP